MTERKVFDIAKHIPLFGLAYRGIRSVAYIAADDLNEASHSIEMDVSDINPIRLCRNITNGVVGAFANLSENIWLGKRTLGVSPIGITLSAGVDLFHWCIQIDGIIYELLKESGRIFINIVAKDDDPNNYKALCKLFDWSLLSPNSSLVSKSCLHIHAKAFEHFEYEAVFPGKRKLNCQYFVIEMLGKARRLTTAEAVAMILVFIPNIVY